MSTLQRTSTLAVLMILMAAVALLMKPRSDLAATRVDLERLVPLKFAGWEAEGNGLPQMSVLLTDPNDPTRGDRATYDQILTRTYRKTNGAQVMLALAYGRRQMQELKIHRPELCYFAQGFSVHLLGTTSIRLDNDRIVRATSLLTESRERKEPVSYWIRIGKDISTSSWQTRWIIFREGVHGSIPDGILVRASSLIDRNVEVASAFTVQQEFLRDLYLQLSPQGRQILAGD